jgi:hypothetical protein
MENPGADIIPLYHVRTGKNKKLFKMQNGKFTA